MRDDESTYYQSEKNGIGSMKAKVDSKEFTVAFGLFPVSVKQLKIIADSECNMPPKNTYIEPKLRSGLTIYKFE